MKCDKKLFSQFEADKKLFERTYNGVPYWQAIRFMVCEGAYSEQIEHADTIRAKNKKYQAISRLLLFPWACLKTTWKFFSLKKSDVICFRHVKSCKEDPKFFNTWKMPPEIRRIYVDDLVNSDIFCCDDICNFAIPYYVAGFSFYLKKALKMLKKDENEKLFLQKLEQEIRDKFGRCPSADRMEREIHYWIEIRRIFEHYFAWLFSKIKCKAIVVVCYYNVFLYPAYQVAKENGIRIIELQHGVISNHQEYWFEDQRGLNNCTPDYFLAFGDAHISWTKLLPTTKAISIGFPYQDVEISRLKNMETEEKTIIIYPQSQPEFEEVINEFANMATAKGYRILLKLHPLQAVAPKEYYPILSQNPNIEVVTKQDTGIYYWLKLGKHHVMASTTVGLEAVAFAHTNICIATFVPHEQTQPLLDWGVARGFNTAIELMDLIENPLTIDKSKARNALWKSNAAKNFESFFVELQQQGWPQQEAYVKGNW